MKNDNAFKKLQKLVSQCTISIVYVPFTDEVDCTDSTFPLKTPTQNFIVPQHKDSDPFEIAEMCKAEYKGVHACIFIPGIGFDMCGTRHGKGGGWYDRFLSAVPRQWIRIGIADESQISKTKLTREKWDEPVDWLVVKNGGVWKVYKI